MDKTYTLELDRNQWAKIIGALYIASREFENVGMPNTAKEYEELGHELDELTNI